ncbi:MAG TPA: C39 family peptidase [Thermodesulfobacteriota bacterium]|nr:C39 family peptidase [Thermodesulfobacteriota bacterium]
MTIIKTTSKNHRGMAIAISFFLLYGCVPNTGILKKNISQDSTELTPKPDFYINNVPFFPQKRYYCGPASLASVMNFYGVSVTEEEIAKEVYNTKLSGTLSMDILIYARTKGFDALYYKGNMEDIKKYISMGKPVILFLDLGYFFYPVRHYIVATGYNDKMGYLIAHSGVEKDKIFYYKEIQSAWEKTGFGAILISPKGK